MRIMRRSNVLLFSREERERERRLLEEARAREKAEAPAPLGRHLLRFDPYDHYSHKRKE